MRSHVSGRVVDGQGEPVAGTRVLVWHGWGTGPEGRERPILGEGRSDAAGRYEMQVDIPVENTFDSVFAAYQKDGFGVHEAWWTYGPPLPPILRLPDVKLAPGWVIAGRVLDHQGRPCPGLEVAAGPSCSPFHPPARYLGATILTTTTDDQGRFRLEGVCHAKGAPLTVAGPGGEMLCRQWGAAACEDVQISLPHCGSIRGVAVWRDTGAPVAGAEVLCRETDCMRLFDAIRKTVTDEHGSFRLELLPPSEYEVAVRLGDSRGKASGLRVHPGEDVECSSRVQLVQTSRDLRIGVTFRESGAPAAGVWISANSSRWCRTSAQAKTDAEGRAAFTGLSPVTYDLWPRLPGRAEPLHADLRRQDHADLDIELMGSGPDSRLGGTVRDAEGRAVPGAWVAASLHPLLMTRTDDSGGYELRITLLVPPESKPFRILAISPDGTMCGTGAVPHDWKTGCPVDIRLDSPLSTASAHVVDARGEPLPDAAVLLHGDHEQGDLSLMYGVECAAVAGADGAFTIGPLDPRLNYYVSASKPGYVGGGACGTPPNLQSGKPLADLVLMRADAVLRGRVMDEAGMPLRDVKVQVWSCGAHASGWSDADGCFELRGMVREDIVTIWACGVDYGPTKVERVVVGGAPVEIRFTGAATEMIAGRVVDGDGYPLPGPMLSACGDHTFVTALPDDGGLFTLLRLVPGTYYIEAGDAERSMSLWEVEAGMRDLDVRFPTAAELEQRRAERQARADATAAPGDRVRLAERAYLTNPGNVGPLPVRDGYWMVRGIKYAGVHVAVGAPGRFAVTLRARRVCRDVIPALNVAVAEHNVVLRMPDYEWSLYTGELELPAGRHCVGMQLKTGWAVDVEWIEIKPLG